MYLVPFASIAPQSSVRLRVHAPRNIQRTGLRWARDYEFDGRLPWSDAETPKAGAAAGGSTQEPRAAA